MKKELKSGILSADKSADHRPINRPTVGGANVIAVLVLKPNSGRLILKSWFGNDI